MTKTTKLSDLSALDALVGMQEGLRDVEAEAEAKRRIRNKYVKSAAEEGHSLSEIGDVLGITKAAVHKIVNS